jgi:2-polyprenyl-3-methyl-5-hydroxy-6-metoxy-1,4-benzoquinol methylase
MDVKELGQLDGPPQNHWYYASKFELLSNAVADIGAKHIVDIGAGSGVFARMLLERTDCVSALCVDPAYQEETDVDVGGKTLRFRRQYAGEQVDLVLMMDVLEHVDDDVGLLRDVLEPMRAGTPVFITVPAFKFMWSAHDEFLDHRRRYTSKSLGATMRAAGVGIDWVRYFYAVIFPIAAAVRLLRRWRDPSTGSDLRPVPSAVTSILKAALKLELKWLFPFVKLPGLSVVALGRRL